MLTTTWVGSLASEHHHSVQMGTFDAKIHMQTPLVGCTTMPRCSDQYMAYTIAEKAIWFRHPDYNLNRAQKLISSSMSRHLSTCNIHARVSE